MVRKRMMFLICAFVLSTPVLAQQRATQQAQQTGTTTATQDPTAVNLATRSLAALNGSLQVADITLAGTATRTAGSDVESGNITLKAMGASLSRFDLAVSGGTRTEIFNLAGDTAQGFWSSADGVQHTAATHNCLAGEVWFFPALSVLSQISDPNLAITYVGQETKSGSIVQHIRLSYQSPSLSAADNQLYGELTVTDIYVDPGSFLPVAIAFNTHPDNDALTNIPVEIDFSNYQAVQGVQVPFRIQKFMNGTLFMDVTITTAQLNSGLASSAFNAN